MTDKLERDIQRGERAKRLLSDELIHEARQHMDAELWRVFRETPPSDSEALKHISAMQYMHGKYFQFLEAAVTNGKLAQINLDAKKKSMAERVRERFTPRTEFRI